MAGKSSLGPWCRIEAILVGLQFASPCTESLILDSASIREPMGTVLPSRWTGSVRKHALVCINVYYPLYAQQLHATDHKIRQKSPLLPKDAIGPRRKPGRRVADPLTPICVSPGDDDLPGSRASLILPRTGVCAEASEKSVDRPSSHLELLHTTSSHVYTLYTKIHPQVLYKIQSDSTN